MIRVLVADDEPLIRAGIATVLASAGDMEAVAQAGDGRAAVTAALAHRVDVALLDIRMPALDGLGALAELRRAAPAVRAVMLTSFGVDAYVLRAVQAGAAGFVLKNCTPDELIGAVRAAHRGDAYLAPAVTRTVLAHVTPADPGRRQAAQDRLDTLSRRETEVLDLLAEGLSNAEISARLRSTETTVKTYVSRILAKVGCANRVQAALLVRDAGGVKKT